MGYSKDIYQQAQRALDESRTKAQRSADQRRDELYAELPQLRELEQTLAATGLAAAQTAIGGGEDAPRLIEQLRTHNLSLQRQRARLLHDAGLPEDFLCVRYSCPRCGDTGYIAQKQCSCLSDLLRKIAYNKLSDTCDIKDCRFENFSLDFYPTQPSGKFNIVPRRAMERVFSICSSFAREFSGKSESLLLCGGTGLGKTHLSLAIAYEVTQRGFGVVYTTSQRLLDKLQLQQFSRNSSADETDYQAVALDCDLLIIDDLGAEFSTSFTIAALYNIINSRIIERRPTIISTNFDETVLRERYGDRILSRLLCAYQPLQFYGEDIRMIKRFSRK
ncbi:ATP-binding protein [Oscillospiraceae bacterium PP1C4]